MKSIIQLAVKRLRFNRGRSLLTMIAIILTACLLTALAAGALGVIEVERERLEASGNQHARIQVNDEQLTVLAHHTEISALNVNETVAEVVYEKMNASLRVNEDIHPGIKGLTLAQGSWPEATNEIAGPPAFFERMGVEARLGAVVSIPYRLQGKGEILEQEFVITGILTQVDLSKLDIADTRLAYAALVSKAFAEVNLQDLPRHYQAAIRLQGTDALSYDEIGGKIMDIAAVLGVAEDDVALNKGYLYFTTDPSAEMRGILLSAAALVLFLSAMVIYCIYYVSVTADIKELGRLKALGATRGQMRQLLLTEGAILSVISLPIGLILGHLAAYGFLRFSLRLAEQSVFALGTSEASVPISPAAIALVCLVILLTVLLSQLGPIRKACKASPIEAMTYQEAGSRKVRRGYDTLNVNRLCRVNLGRNRKRTAVTMLTMGLSCVLFVVMVCVLSSTNPQDFARNNMPAGDFRLELDYRLSDDTYPENTLSYKQQDNVLGRRMVQRLLDIPGVTEVVPVEVVAGDLVMLSNEEKRVDIKAATRAQFDELQSLCQAGALDYEQMVQEGGLIYTWGERNLAEVYGLSLGDTVTMTLFDGQREVPFTGKIMAITSTADSTFLLPQELFHQLITDVEPTAALTINVNPKAYEEVKQALQQIAGEEADLQLISFDEELQVARFALLLVKAPVYGVLILLGVIGFINLINTMISSILSRQRELGILQAIGLSDKQLMKMLQREGLFFTAGTLVLAMTIGNLLGVWSVHWAKNNGLLGITQFHYPIMPMLIMAAALIAGQVLLAWLIGRYIHKDSLIERIRLE